MGCGSSVAQVSDSMKDGIFKPLRLVDIEKQNEGVQNEGKVYLFGQTRTQRKIIQLNLSSNYIRSLSNRVRIPIPRIHYDPIQVMYEQTQQIFHLGVYGLSVLPPFNKMVALYLQQNIIFLCGGKDFDSFNIKNQAFYYTINDENKNKTNQNYNSSQENGRTELKSKFSTNKFQKIASMNVSRYGHMGIYIQKLKSILIFGGINQKQEIINSCEKYGVLDNTWRDIPSMNQPRANGACFLFNNKVYLFGGKNSNIKKSKKIQVFHCETNHWEILSFKLHRGIEEPLIFSQRPNEIIIVGGKACSGPTKSVIKVNMVNQTLLWDSSLNYEYQSVKGIKTKSNIIIFGGKKDSFELYENSKWTQKKFDNKKIIELDEIGLFSYSSQSQHISYQPVQEKLTKRILQDQLIIFGNDQYPCMLICNLSSKIMTKQPVSMTLKIRSKMSIVEYESGKYFLAGGCDWKQGKSFNSTYFYNSETNEFQQSVKMGQKKHSFAICSSNGYIYIFGGYDSLDKLAKKTCAKFNLSNESWESLPTLRRARRNCHCLVINSDKIAIFGGLNGLEDVAGIEILNTNDKKFDIYEPNLYIPRSILCAYSKNDNFIYLINKKQSADYQLTSISLVPGNINSNRSVVSNNLQTIDHNALKQQRPQSNISQRDTQIVKIREPSNVNSLTQSKGNNESTDNLKTINIKPTFIEIRPKNLKSQSSQINQLHKEQQNQLDQSFQLQKVDLNKYNTLKQTNELLDEQSKKETIKQHGQFLIQKQQPIQIHNQIASQKEEQVKPLENVKQQEKAKEQAKLIIDEVKLITHETIDWLKIQEYTVIDRISRVYFLTHTQCIELHKNTGEIKSIKIQNCSNVSLQMIK